MSALQNILNPPNEGSVVSEPSMEQQQHHHNIDQSLEHPMGTDESASSPSPHSPSTMVSPSMSTMGMGPFSREKVAMQETHTLHPNCPDALSCLPDTHGRPQHTLPVILRCAILGSPRQRLTIREIYAAMEEKYPYYKSAGQTWKQSVRHHLSLNRLFERQTRPVTEPGFGSYWTVNLMAPPGTKRPRKRGKPGEKPVNPDGSPLVKKRGRPRKSDGEGPIDTIVPDLNGNPLPPMPQHVISPHAHGYGEDMEGVADEEYDDTEDDPEVLTNNSKSTPSRPAGSRSNPPRAAAQKNGGRHSSASASVSTAKLQKEIEDLRRQNQEAQRVSEQLAEAQAEASRAKAALRAAEAMLEDESRKRRDAEKTADEETKARLAAEIALKQALSGSMAVD